MGTPTDRQLWFGNVPGILQEDEVIEELALRGVRAIKIVLRSRSGADSWAVCTFATANHASAALAKEAVFHNKSRALFRPALPRGMAYR